MNSELFIDNLINHIDDLNHHSFNKNNFIIKKKIRIKKEINENPLILKEYKANRIESMKKNNKLIKKENFIDINNKIDIDIFDKRNINQENNQNNNTIKTHDNTLITDDNNNSLSISFYDLNKDDKLNLIKDFMSRKKIYIETNEFEKINEIIDNNELLKKHISITKLHNQISKISFFKKKDDFSYYIDFNIQKKKKQISFFK